MQKSILLILLFGCLLCVQAIAQNRTVSGVVTSSSDGSPLPGVNVVIKGTTTGATTNTEGRYSLDNVPANATLQISFVGFLTQEIAAGSRSTLDVRLENDIRQLGEVVVTALGLEQSRDQFGSAASQVKGGAVARSGEATLINGLSGKASGVQIVRSSGDPGAGSYIQIRGQSTITGNLQPLIILDGVPIYNSTLGNAIDGVVQQSRLNDINPEDIASVEVLKGASAAAVWGTRAANGVIVITTKRGTAGQGKINVNFKSSVSVDQIYKTHPLQNTYGQGADGQFRFGNQAGGRSWGDRIADRTGGTDTYITEGQTGYQGYFEGANGERFYSIASGNATNPHGGKNSRDTYDYRDTFFKTGYFVDNSISLSGGDRNSNFYLSLGDLNQEGIIRYNSDYRRTTARVNAERRFNDFIRLNSNFGYTRTRSNRIQQGSNVSGLYLGGLRTPADFNVEPETGTYVSSTGLRFPNRQRSYRNPLGGNVPPTPNNPFPQDPANSVYDNPIWTQKNVLSTSEVDRFLGKFEVILSPLKWLDVTGRVGLDNYADRRRDFFPAISSANFGGLNAIQTARETQTDVQLFGNAKYQLNPKVNLNAIVGLNLNSRTYENNGGQARNFILAENPPPFDITNSQAENRTPFSTDFEQQRTAALYATATVGFSDYLFVNATGRLESASSFGRQTKRTFFYPAADLAFQFTEAFASLRDNTTLSFGKLRLAYGEVGVQPSPYNTVTYFNQGALNSGEYQESWGPILASGAYGNGGYFQSSTLGNAALRPERKKEFEIGTDLRFVRDRFTLNATYFQNRTTDAILSVATAPTTGFDNLTGNAAEIQNKGVELDLGANLVQNSNFSWNLQANFTRYRNKVVSLSGTQSLFLAGYAGTSSRAVEGQPLGVLWGTAFLRNDAGQLVLDANGFPQAAPQESVLGDPNPDFKMGIGNTFTFKGLSLYALWDMQVGGQIWGGTRGALFTFGRHADVGNDVTATQDLPVYGTTAQYPDGVVPSGTTFRGAIQDFGGGPVALTEAWYTSLGGGFGPVAEQFIERADYQRLREVTLSYSLKSDAFRRFSRLSSVDFSLTGRNLLLITPFQGNDPETNNTGTSNGRGLDYFNNPATRSVLFTIRINY